jgi:hypothetical protein
MEHGPAMRPPLIKVPIDQGNRFAESVGSLFGIGKVFKRVHVRSLGIMQIDFLAGTGLELAKVFGDFVPGSSSKVGCPG